MIFSGKKWNKLAAIEEGRDIKRLKARQTANKSKKTKENDVATGEVEQIAAMKGHT